MMRHGMLLLIGSIVLCSGCTTRKPVQAMVVHQTLECPAPERPELPVITGALPLDHSENVETLMERDDMLRQYIQGLQDCVECYRRQATKEAH